MAAGENHTISLMGGDDPGIRGSSVAVEPMGDTHSVSGSSSIQIFVRAKKKINDIFMEIEDYICDTVTYMQSVQQDGTIVKSEDAVQLEGYIAKVRAIRNVLNRNNMKVAFFGRTSNGKSSVINAMLHEKILPSGCGHTTNCFLQVEGSDSGESYLVTEDSTERQNVMSVEQLAHALCKEKLGESQLVHIYWPKDKCLLLRDDVVFVDSPGFDMSPNFDDWIDRHCLDADVFVFVANAVSTLTLAEKNFFHKVSTRLAKPNIFILNNYWDFVTSETDLPDKVRAQHMERAVEFLVTELKVCTQKEANQRIFFVSAKEALQARLQEQKGLPAHSGAFADGFPDRYFEFQDFERKFEECISKSAVRTKFEQHSQRGQLIVSEIRQIMDSKYDQAQQLKTQKAAAKKEIHDKLNFTKQQLLLRTQEMEDKIRQMVEDVKQRVSKALNEEIDHLSVLVDEFHLPFHPEQLGLNMYKKQLYHHVENGLVSKLRERLSTALAVNIENSQREMTERMSGLLPAEKKQASLNTLPRREPFEILYRLNCDSLFTDFHENFDLKYLLIHFSSMFTNSSQQEDNNGDILRLIASICSLGLLIGRDKSNMVGAEVVIATALSAVTSLYTLLNKVKPIVLKWQFVAYVTEKQGLIVDWMSDDCSKQVEQELSSTFEQLRDLINEATNDMDAEVKTLDEEIEHLEEVANSAKVLQNKGDNITKQLEIFDDEFLKLRN